MRRNGAFERKRHELRTRCTRFRFRRRKPHSERPKLKRTERRDNLPINNARFPRLHLLTVHFMRGCDRRTELEVDILRMFPIKLDEANDYLIALLRFFES